MRTYSVKKAEIKRQWHVIDATDRILGELASEAAKLLMGKNKPYFTRNLDVGDYVVVVNAAKVRVTGKKPKQMVYRWHSGYPGGLKEVIFEKMLQTRPTRVIEHAVKGMLPHNRLGSQMIKKLKVYAGAEHPHAAQVKETAAVDSAAQS
jgi:large subunit ribosomal protein L13